MPEPTNQFLEGGFAPVGEERTAVDLEVTGSLPDFLDGSYLRNGPNPVTAPDPAAYDWFMGTGMVHGLRLRDGRAEWYRNRWVRSAAVARQVGDAPRPGPVHAGMDLAPNTHVVRHAGRTLALIEGGALPYELDDELGTVGPCDFDGTLCGGYSAHPLRDPLSGELHAVSYYWGWGHKVRYTVTGTDGRVRHSVDLDVGGALMMHAFSLTERHVVLFDLPVTFDLTLLPGKVRMPGWLASLAAAGLGRLTVPDAVAARFNRGAAGGTVLPYSWDPDRPARVGVMPRDGGSADLHWMEVDPCLVYHPVNAYDDGPGRVVVEVPRHARGFSTAAHVPSDGEVTLERWTLDLPAGKVIEERVDDTPQEFPRIDERLVGRRHRYAWTVAYGEDRRTVGLHKHDFATGRSQRRDLGPGTAPDEFVFVPSSPDAGEDEGVLMGYVYDVAADRSRLEVLDAGSMETVATVALPARVPHGFHGSWLPTTGPARP